MSDTKESALQCWTLPLWCKEKNKCTCSVFSLCRYEAPFSFIPLSIEGRLYSSFSSYGQRPSRVCVCCSGSRARLRATLYCSSHITVLGYKTSWWHGFSQGHISVDPIPCTCRELGFSLHGSILADIACAVQGWSKSLIMLCFSGASSRKKWDRWAHISQTMETDTEDCISEAHCYDEG